MTLKEVAEYLHLNERTIYKWAQDGTIPASKLGSTWRFRRSEIDVWVEQRKNVPSGQPGQGGVSNGS
ncbi:MAG: helix-turn-helix domain-containing protein [Acidobacteriia bacterium]|nr:helix-turn-helix domain-containing protein [Terriglobia bacterium]